MKQIDRDIRDLPKAHLHVHLTGAMQLSTLQELARVHDITIPNFTESRRYTSWRQFYRAYGAGHSVLHSCDELARLVCEVVADAGAEGAVWIEISVSLPGYRSLTGGDDATLDIIAGAAADAATTSGVGVGLVIAPDRARDAAEAENMARFIVKWADRGVVGFGLGGDDNYPSSPFARAAAIADDGGLYVVPHAGELAGAESMKAMMQQLHPDRIMHGIRVIEDPTLVATLAAAGICLDVCPSSNAALGVVDGLDTHPLPQLLRAGVPCSLNADAPFVFGTSLAHEYQLAREVLGLTDGEFALLARASLTASAAPRSLVSKALDKLGAWNSAVADC